MTVKDELPFLQRREAEERALADAAGDDDARQAHRNLADAYAERIAEINKAAD